MKTRTILIDDERKAIEILKNKIERFCPDLEIIATSQSSNEGIQVIKSLNPELVFLDITMPEKNGFDILKEFENPKFEVIFATAHDEYAIEAFKHSAIGYLLKPIDNHELIKTVQSSIKNIQSKVSFEKNSQFLKNLTFQNQSDRKIAIPCMEGIDFIPINEILYCQGEDGYTKIHVQNKKPIISSNSIGYFKSILENQNFYLTHKSFLINLSHTTKYLNEGYIILSEDHTVPVARSKRKDFLTRLKY